MFIFTVENYAGFVEEKKKKKKKKRLNLISFTRYAIQADVTWRQLTVSLFSRLALFAHTHTTGSPEVIETM